MTNDPPEYRYDRIAAELELMGLEHVRIEGRAVIGLWGGNPVVKRGPTINHALSRMWRWVIDCHRREARRIQRESH